MLLPLVNGTFVSESPDSNRRRSINMYPIVTGPNARSSVTSGLTSGLKELIDLGGTACRGIVTVNGFTYVVVDNTVYQLQIDRFTQSVTSQKTCGIISTSTGPIRFAYNPTQLLILDGSPVGFFITLGNGGLVHIVDTDFMGGAQCAFCDGYIFYNQPNTAKMWCSDLNDVSSWNALNVATAESNPDNLVGLGIYKGELWAIGEKSVEVWFDNANSPGFPFSLRVGSTIDIGCAAPNSIVQTNDALIWLDSRGFIVQSDYSVYVRNQNSGYDLHIISDASIQTAISSYQVISDAIATAYNDRGHLMYQITFPTEHKTWVYDQSTKVWFERGTWNETSGKMLEHLIQFTNEIETTVIGCGINSGKIYIMSHDFFDDDGIPIHRKLISAPVAVENQLIEIRRLELRMGSGNATPTGLGSDPQIALRCSSDGGHTWSNYSYRSMGKTGEYGKPITWNRLGAAREWMFEFSICEPIDFSIIEASMDVELEFGTMQLSSNSNLRYNNSLIPPAAISSPSTGQPAPTHFGEN